MLDSFRKISKTWLGKIIGAFLIVGLAGFGISNVIFDIGSNTVARVGDEEINAREFQRAYNSDLQRFAQQAGRIPTTEEALALGIPTSTLNRLASDAAINQLSEDMGIGVSDARLGKMLREDPTFAGTLGQFERQNFLRVLQQSGFTETEYFALQTRAARRQQLAAGLFADVAAPGAALELVERYTGDTRRIDYFILNEQSIAPVAEPTEEELAAYLTEHQEEFRTEETRSVDLTALSPETLAATKTVSEADIAAEYERTRASRTNPERRHIQQVALTTDAQQEIFESGLASGESFEDLVAEAGVTPRDLGTRSATEITDAALAEAAFGLAEGEFVIIPGIGGQRAVAVTAIEPGGEVSLAEVRDEIAQSLAEDEARDEYLDVLDQIEELRAAFQPLSQIAERFGLEVYPVTVSADGSELAEVPAVPEEDRQQVASNIFAAEAEQLTPAIMLSANHSVWFDLKEIVPARDQTLGEVREAVRTAIMDERTATALSAETERLLAELDAGTPFAEVAAEAGHQPVTSEAFGRSGSSIGGIGPEVAAAAFTGGEDHHGAAVSGAGEHVVFEVAEIIPATESASAEIAQYMEQTTRDSLFAEFVGGIRDEAGLRINRQAFDQLIALDPATGL